jgi:hypothetical protein
MNTLFPLLRPKRTLEARRVSLIKRLLRVAAILEACDGCADAPNLRTIDATYHAETDDEITPEVMPITRLDRAIAKLEKWLRAIECCLLDRDPSAPEPAPEPDHSFGRFSVAPYRVGEGGGYKPAHHGGDYHGKSAVALLTFKNCTVAEWLGTAKRKAFSVGDCEAALGVWRGQLCEFWRNGSYTASRGDAKWHRSRCPGWLDGNTRLGDFLGSYRRRFKASTDITFDPSTLAP